MKQKPTTFDIATKWWLIVTHVVGFVVAMLDLLVWRPG